MQSLLLYHIRGVALSCTFKSLATKIAKGESRSKTFVMVMPSRILSSTSVKGSERREQKQNFRYGYAEPHPVFDVSQRQ